jgi:hypothetical protein
MEQLSHPAAYSRRYPAAISDITVCNEDGSVHAVLEFNKTLRSWGYSFTGHRFKAKVKHQFAVEVYVPFCSRSQSICVTEHLTSTPTETFFLAARFGSTEFSVSCQRRAYVQRNQMMVSTLSEHNRLIEMSQATSIDRFACTVSSVYRKPRDNWWSS